MMMAFVVCEKLGIDDPVYWWNQVGDKILDQWIAYYSVKSDGKKGKPMTGDQARDFLSANYG